MAITLLSKRYVDIKDLFLSPDKYIDTEVTVVGLIQSTRKQRLTTPLDDGTSVSKEFYFVHLSDSHVVPLQVIFDETEGDFTKYYPLMTTHSSIKVKGLLVKSPAKGQPIELKAKEILYFGQVLNPSLYPLSHKYPKPEELREHPHLRARSRWSSTIAQIGSALALAVHTFYQANGYAHIRTPILTGSDCEGGGEVFCVTSLLKDKLEEIPTTTETKTHHVINEEGVEVVEEYTEKTSTIDFKQDAFAKRTYLTVSGQLHVEAAYAVHKGPCYVFGPFFRKEGSASYKHAAEGWMIEPETWFCELSDLIDTAEASIKFCIEYILTNCKAEMIYRDSVKKGLIDKLTKYCSEPFIRIRHSEAVEILKEAVKKGVKFTFPISDDMDFSAEHERYLTETYYDGKFVAITHWPSHIKAFYMLKSDDDPTVVECFDIICPYVGEIVGGSMREHRLEMLEAEMEKRGMDKSPLDFYLDLRKCGSVPHGGWGIGFDRLMMVITGADNIKDIAPFPRYSGHCPY